MGWLGRLFGGGGQKGGATTMASPGMKKKAGKEMMGMAKDPVCGMEVSETSAAGKTEYMGKSYYFCAQGCKKTFDADPAKYVGGGGQQMGQGGHGGHGGHMM